MHILRLGLISAAAFAGGAAFAQAMPGSTVGLTATGLPSDPFASNYPSEVPPQMQRDRRGSTVHRRAPVRKGRSAERLRPPADIHMGSSGR